MLPGLTVSRLRLKLVRAEVDEVSTLVVEEVGELKQVWSQKTFFLLFTSFLWATESEAQNFKSEQNWISDHTWLM